MPIRIDGDNATATPGITGGDADTGLVFGTDEIEAVTGGTTRFTVENNGNVTVENGNLVLASGSGIDFSATADGTGATNVNELFDDYEEGSFSPVLEQATSNPTNIVYSYQRGKYTKVGNVVTVWFDFDLTSFIAGSGRFRVGGLPFNSVSGQDHGGFGAPNFRSSTAMELEARLNSTSAYHTDDYIELRHINNSGNEDDTTVAGGRITGMSFYYTT